jgi:hypothetical protein
MSWVMPHGVMDLFACWWKGGRSRSVVVWKMVPLYLIWRVWSERNAIYFEDSERNVEELLFFFFYSFHLDSSLACHASD